MCVCVCVCVCVCMCVSVPTHACTSRSVCVCIFVCLKEGWWREGGGCRRRGGKSICVCAHVCVYVYVCACVCMYVYVCLCACACACVLIIIMYSAIPITPKVTDRRNDGKTTSHSRLALNGKSYYGKWRTKRSGGSWL